MLYKIKDLVMKKGLLRGPFGGALKKEIFVPKSETTYKVYEQGCVLNKDHTVGRYYITEDYFLKKMKNFEVKPGDILVSCSGVNYGAIYRLPLGVEKGIINQALLRIRVNEEIVDPQYFCYLFENLISKIITSGSGDSTIPNFPPIDVIKEIQINVPPLLKQKKISSFLDSFQSKIEINKEIIAVLTSKIKDGYSFYSRQYNVTPDNLRNDDFHSKESLKVKSLFSFEKGKEPSAGDGISKVAIKYYRVRDIDSNSFSTIWDNCELTIAKYGDIVYSLDGTIGKISYQVDGAISSGLYIVHPKLIDKNVFAYCVMSDESIIKKLQYGSRSNTIIKHASGLLTDLCIEISINGSLYFSEIFNKAFLMCIALAKENIKIETQKMFYASLMLCGVLQMEN